MTEVRAIVFAIDDDAPLRESLQNLMRSVGLQVTAFASAQEFLRSPRPMCPAVWCLTCSCRASAASICHSRALMFWRTLGMISHI
jgi:FixJ family two-component response regulator